MLFMVLGLVTILTMSLLTLYLRWIPEGQGCPRCGAVTVGERSAEDLVGRGLERWVVNRTCPACGWSGRLRRGPEPELVRTRGPSKGVG